MQQAQPHKQGKPHELPQAGWRRAAWCKAIGISVPMSYRLPQKPHTVKLGKACIFTESPAAYLERIAQQQAK
jgi:hypothetical protein